MQFHMEVRGVMEWEILLVSMHFGTYPNVPFHKIPPTQWNSITHRSTDIHLLSGYTRHAQPQQAGSECLQETI